VRENARTAIGKHLAPTLHTTYTQMADPGPYRIDGVSIGRRSIRNTCLGYLALGDQEMGIRLAKAQFDASQSMTDVLAALWVLAALDCRERQGALQSFYDRWHDDDLVLDKWFAIQAMSPLATPDEVRKLAQHKDFDLRNPNRVRAVISSFSSGNPYRFHDPSGDGYRFLAETIIALDPSNSQVAARLVSPLGQWRRVDAARQALMKAELQRILDTAKLSRNTFEMASRSLT